MSQSDALSAAQTLRLIGPPPEDWVPPRPGIDHNVLVVGGGHTGSTFAFALRRAGIGRVSVIDAAPDEASSGVWLTRARMNKLRTPKAVPGPELGLPGLSFQAWYEGRFGRKPYEALDRILREDWAAYLAWYRRVLGIAVRYGTILRRIEPAGDHLRLHLEVEGVPRVETARKVILGTGIAGSGRARVIPALAALPPSRHAHTSEAIDFAVLKGRTVAVVGAGASAFDTAAVALESGAGSVHLFARRDHVAALPVIRPRGYPGAYDNYPRLPDAVRWEQALRFRRAGSPPPPDAVERAVRFANFHLHLGAPWTEAAAEGDEVVTRIAGEAFRFDFVISGTGYAIDLAARPELAGFADRILLWRDRYTPPEDQRDEELGAHPYLGLGHQLQERVPDEAPFLKNVHVYNPGGFVSFGLPIGDVPSIRRDVPAVVSAIGRDLFFDDFAHHHARITAPVAPDFDETLYAASVWRRPQTLAAE